MKKYSRYSKFQSNSMAEFVPFIKVPQMNTDLFDYYEKGRTRLDLLSYQYYLDPNYGWLILQANPEYGSLEFNIPNGAKLRIPYPLDLAMVKYEEAIALHRKLNGNEKQV